MLTERELEIIRALRSGGNLTFSELAKVAGLDPATDFRRADLSDVDFQGSDLSGFDFTGALLKGARFEGARIASSTIFDEDTPADRLNRSRQSVWNDFAQQLAAYQLEIVQNAANLLTSGAKAALVSMPSGTGRHLVAENLLGFLSKTVGLRSCLIVVETNALRDQVTMRFADASRKHPGNFGNIAIQVTTDVALRKRIEETHSLREKGDTLGPDLLVAFAATGKLAAIMADLTGLFEDMPPVIGFTTLPSNWFTRGVDSEVSRLIGRFQENVIQFTFEEAVRDGILVPITILEPPVLVPTPMGRLASDKFDSDLPIVARDFLDHHRRLAAGRDSLVRRHSLVICRTVEEVRKVVDLLRKDIVDSDDALIKVEALAKNPTDRPWEPDGGSSLIVVATKALVEASPDWLVQKAAAIGIFRPVGYPLLDQLLFRTRKADNGEGMLIDYTRTVPRHTPGGFARELT